MQLFPAQGGGMHPLRTFHPVPNGIFSSLPDMASTAPVCFKSLSSVPHLWYTCRTQLDLVFAARYGQCSYCLLNTLICMFCIYSCFCRRRYRHCSSCVLSVMEVALIIFTEYQVGAIRTFQRLYLSRQGKQQQLWREVSTRAQQLPWYTRYRPTPLASV